MAGDADSALESARIRHYIETRRRYERVGLSTKQRALVIGLQADPRFVCFVPTTERDPREQSIVVRAFIMNDESFHIWRIDEQGKVLRVSSGEREEREQQQHATKSHVRPV